MSATVVVRRLEVLIPFVIAALIGGCQNTETPDANGDFAIGDSASQALTQAAGRYVELSKSQPPDAARAALVTELNAGFSGAAEAELASDGYSIRVVLADGTVAAINTNDAFFAPPDASSSAGLVRALTPSRKPLVTTSSPAITPCPDTATPTRSVRIINAAAATNPDASANSVAVAQGTLENLGWSSSDIDVIARIGAADRTVVPEHFLNLADSGIVIVIGHGGVWRSADGREHFHLQCCAPGSREGLQPQANRDRYNAWIREGKLAAVTSTAESGEPVTEFWMRDDLFTEFLELSPAGLVYLMVCNSWLLSDAFARDSVGSFFAWDMAMEATTAEQALRGLLGNMADAPKTDQQALAALAAGGAAATGFAGLELNSDAKASYLTAWAVAEPKKDELPPDTALVNVHLERDACPSSPIEFSTTPDEPVDLVDLLPGTAVVKIEAQSADGRLLGTGLVPITIHGGGNNKLELKVCKGNLAVTIGDCPPGTAKVHVELTYKNTELTGPDELESAPAGTIVFEDVWSTSAELYAVAADDTGAPLSTSKTDVNIACGENEATTCFGWAKLQAREYPDATKSIRVTSTGGSVSWPATLAPAGSLSVYDYDLPAESDFTADALDSVGSPIATQTIHLDFACGENEVNFDIINYGIIVTPSKDRLQANGEDSAVVTATLRRWTDGDVTEPTGDPVVGRLVHFASSLGTVSPTDPVATDANGQASVTLTAGTQAGTAELHAFVPEDVVENSRKVYVTIAAAYGILVSPSADPATGGTAMMTATLKEFTPTDGSTATGDPVAGKEVTFSTNFGTLSGPNPVVTNANGQASIQISSATNGTAKVTAAVLDDETEGSYTLTLSPEGASDRTCTCEWSCADGLHIYSVSCSIGQCDAACMPAPSPECRLTCTF